MNRILIVDDEKNVLSSFRKILAEDGYEIMTAGNAEEGLSVIGKTPVDVLIMDIRMGVLNGLEAFSKFKGLDSKLPIIMMTAYGTTETAIEAMRLGAFDYVIKPFEVQQMKSLIGKAVAAGQLMKKEVVCDARAEFKGERIIGRSPKMQEIYQTINIDVRLITATNKFLEVLMKEGKFREDLYYRLNAVTIILPSLRERKDDIPLLADYFLQKYNCDFSRTCSNSCMLCQSSR